MKPDFTYKIGWILVIMVLVITGPQPEARTVGGPKAVLPETSFDFGSVHEGEDVRHPFVLQNKGDAPLVITDVKTD